MKRWQFWLGLAIGAGCIAWVVSTIENPGSFIEAISAANYWYLIPITAVYFVMMALRALRWQYILNHCGHAGYKNTFVSILVCYMGNNVFPLRAGEFMRVFLIGKQEESISYSSALATVVVERLFDFMIVLLSLALVLMIIRFPEGGIPITVGEEAYDLVAVFRAMGTGTLIGAVILFTFLILLAVRTAWVMGIADGLMGFFVDRYEGMGDGSLPKRVLKERPKALRELVMGTLEKFSVGLTVMGRPRALFLLLFLSIVIWVVNLSPVWLTGMAFDEIGRLEFSACLFLLVAGAAAASIPGPPGSFGIFHAFNQIALVFYMTQIMGQPVTNETALSFSIIVHGCYFFPVTVAGAVAAWVQGYSLTKIREEAAELEQDGDGEAECGE